MNNCEDLNVSCATLLKCIWCMVEPIGFWKALPLAKTISLFIGRVYSWTVGVYLNGTIPRRSQLQTCVALSVHVQELGIAIVVCAGAQAKFFRAIPHNVCSCSGYIPRCSPGIHEWVPLHTIMHFFDPGRFGL